MRKYYDTTIEKTTWTSRPALEKMIACCILNQEKILMEEKIFWRAESQKKKISSES